MIRIGESADHPTILPFVSWPLAAVVALVAGAIPGSLEGQRASERAVPAPVHGEIGVNTESERYLRALQVAGRVDPYPWSLRSFSVLETDRLAPATEAHPWSRRYAFRSPAGGWARPTRAAAGIVYNTSFPYGFNDGPVWAGRGATLVLEAGGVARWGPVTLNVQPVLSWAQNADFELLPTGLDGDGRFGDPIEPTRIDLPQRFGEGGYTVIHPGQSVLRFDHPWLTLGASTANLHWGPAQFFPILLGSNAPGFQHLFVGTGTPRPVGIGTVHGRVVWGRLDESGYAPSGSGNDGRRFMSGLVVVFRPRGLEGLELGASRFIHQSWDDRDFLRPFQGLLERSLGAPDDPDRFDADNQLLSVFFRWAFPESGFEAYAEYGREDRNADLRDLALEPDHDAAFVAGVQKVWAVDSAGLWSAGFEWASARPGKLEDVRNQVRFYRHSTQRQGHTHDGQLLGSPAIRGGGGLMARVDRYHPEGRWGVRLERVVVAIEEEIHGLDEGARDHDVLYTLGVDGILFRDGFELVGGSSINWNLNRHFRDDRLNLSIEVGARFRPREVLRW